MLGTLHHSIKGRSHLTTCQFRAGGMIQLVWMLALMSNILTLFPRTHEPIWQKERTDSRKLSPDHHICTMAYNPPPTLVSLHSHTQVNKCNFKNFKNSEWVRLDLMKRRNSDQCQRRCFKRGEICSSLKS